MAVEEKHMDHSHTEANTTPTQYSEFDSRQLARALVAQYAPTARRAVKITDWPDALRDRDLTIHDQATGSIVADINFEAGPADRAYLTLSADYTRPLVREPFDDIEAPETLPPAGGLIFEIGEAIDWIVMSPHAERNTFLELEALFARLQEEHGYSPEAIRTKLIAEAKDRGDLSVGSDSRY